MARPLGSGVGALIGIALLTGALAGFGPGSAPAFAKAPAALGDSLRAVSAKTRAREPQWVARRRAWQEARAERRAARWTGSLADMVRALRREASLESLYLYSIDPAKPDPQHPATVAEWRDAALDALEDGRDDLGGRILAGPGKDDEALLALRARAALTRGAPDSGLVILAWPPHRARAASRSRHALDLPALFVAGTLADSAREPAAARAAYWTILKSHPTPAARRTARLRLGSLLLAGGEPRLALAIVHPEEEASVEAALLAASARAALGDS
ncbi:MAG: hypothetical protein ACM3PF_06735, partial [Bacteroidota bacterium]